MDKNAKFFLPSIADIFFLVVFVKLSVTTGRGLLNDGDTGYHVRAGEYILKTFSIPRQDIFSFITPPLPWTAHEWLSEVIMALIHYRFGLTGILIFFSFIIALTYYLLFKIAQASGRNLIVSIVVVSLAIAASHIHWLARPHIFSLLLTLLWYNVLDRYQYRNTNYLYILPLLMILWVNLHGGFIFGLILLGIYLLGNIVELLLLKPNGSNAQGRQRIKIFSLTTIACLLASIINPYGYNILVFPFKLTSNRFIMDNVQEFLSPNFHNWMPFEYMLLLAIAIFALSRSQLNIIELSLMLLLTHMSLYSARYIPLFAIVATPILLRHCDLILEQMPEQVNTHFQKRSANLATIDRSSKGHLWPVVGLTTIALLAVYGKIVHKFDKSTKPVAAVEFLQREKLTGNMFNNDEFGDYMIYTAWPTYKVFFDGRSDMYGTAKAKEYVKVTRLQPGWERVIEKYDISWIIYNSKSALSAVLLEREDWHLIYSDNVANIFVKKTPENRFVIDKYPNVRIASENGQTSH